MATTVGRGSGHSPANVTKNLKGIDFPASKQDLLKHARHLKAEKIVIDEIQAMDEREYNSMADVMKAFGHQGESSTSSQKVEQVQAGQGKSSQVKSHGKAAHHR